MTDDNPDVEGQIYELIRRLIMIGDNVIAPIEVSNAEISGKRGIFGEPSYQELTIKVKYMEDSELKEEKLKQLTLLNEELGAEKTRIVKEINRMNVELGRDTSV